MLGLISRFSSTYPISFIAFLAIFSISILPLLVTSPEITILFLVANVSMATLELESCFRYSSNKESDT